MRAVGGDFSCALCRQVICIMYITYYVCSRIYNVLCIYLYIMYCVCLCIHDVLYMCMTSLDVYQSVDVVKKRGIETGEKYVKIRCLCDLIATYGYVPLARTHEVVQTLTF
jgi:hypothetical protein